MAFIRNQDDQITIQRRMSRVDTEVSYWHHYDYIIINDSIERSLKQLLSIVQAERLRKKRQVQLHNFITQFVTNKSSEKN